MSAVSHVVAQFLRILPRARIGRAIGHVADHAWTSPVGRAVVGLYARVYDVSFEECERNSGWPTFDAFFTRKLRAGARVVNPDPRTVVSPADGTIADISRIDAGGTFSVKGRPYTVEELLGDPHEAKRFQGGAGVVVYLSPRDYHRVHAPVSGIIHRIRSIPGDYFPVNAVGMRHVPKLFCRNRRVAIEIDAFGELGRVTVVMVVAMIVGRITTVGVAARDVPPGEHAFATPLRVERGDEIGVFHLGSTAVVFIEPRAVGNWLVAQGPVRYGQALSSAPSDPAQLIVDTGFGGTK